MLNGKGMIIHLIVGLIKRNTTGTHTSKLALKSNLASLKAKDDKIDVEILKTVPVNLSKLSNLVNNDVVKKICV